MFTWISAEPVSLVVKWSRLKRYVILPDEAVLTKVNFRLINDSATQLVADNIRLSTNLSSDPESLVQLLMSKSSRNISLVSVPFTQLPVNQLEEGTTVTTSGYYESGDNGSATYLITKKCMKWSIPLGNGLYANITNTDYVAYRMFGAKLDGESDDYDAMLKAHAYADSLHHDDNYTCKVINNHGIIYKKGTEPIVCHSDVDLGGSVLLIDGTNASESGIYQWGTNSPVVLAETNWLPNLLKSTSPSRHRTFIGCRVNVSTSKKCTALVASTQNATIKDFTSEYLAPTTLVHLSDCRNVGISNAQGTLRMTNCTDILVSDSELLRSQVLVDGVRNLYFDRCNLGKIYLHNVYDCYTHRSVVYKHVVQLGYGRGTVSFSKCMFHYDQPTSAYVVAVNLAYGHLFEGTILIENCNIHSHSTEVGIIQVYHNPITTPTEKYMNKLPEVRCKCLELTATNPDCEFNYVRVEGMDYSEVHQLVLPTKSIFEDITSNLPECTLISSDSDIHVSTRRVSKVWKVVVRDCDRLVTDRKYLDNVATLVVQD